MKRYSKGVISVEASISLTIFIFAFLAVTSLTMLVRAESKIQYALNQTAKEFSEYTYIYSKAKEMAGKNGGQDETKEVDELVNNLNDFNHMISKAVTKAPSSHSVSGSDIFNTINEKVNGAYTDAKDIYESGEVLYNQLKSYSDDPSIVLSQIYSVIKNQAVGAVKSQILAPVVAKLLMPKYIAEDAKSANEYLENLGVKGGFNGMNFALSSIMDDGTTISFTVVYKINYDIPLIGDYDFSIKQTATCAAWGDSQNLSHVSMNLWNKSIDKRNEEVTRYEKKTNATIAIADDDVSGFDLYDASTNTITQVTTMDSSILNNVLVVDEAKFKDNLKQQLEAIQAKIGSTKQVKMKDGQSVEISDSPQVVLKVYFPEGMAITDTQAQIYANSLTKDYSGMTIQIRSYEGS